MPRAQRDKPATRKAPTRRLLLALLPALLLGTALVPAQAVAQDGGSNRCTASVRATQDPAVAAVDLECSEPILSVQLEMNEQNEGSIDANSGTRCEPRGDSRREFDCFPEGGDRRSISFRYRLDGDTPVCAEPRLRVAFTVDFEDGSTERLTEEVSGCPRERFDRDTGRFPRGGVDSGAGGATSSGGSDGPGGAVPSIAVSLTVLGLLGATAAVRRRRAR